ncbi:MAG: hypothetical protein HYW07_16235 [Candidatus Latescibacteria bacterium]|nr:hypothetical protein [Candidatus Latescibacterota bacterium]
MPPNQAQHQLLLRDLSAPRAPGAPIPPPRAWPACRPSISPRTPKASCGSAPGTAAPAASTGIGIPVEDLPHIFEEFRQSGRQGEGEKQGSGLGLAIASKSVELLGGNISVESQLGRGTKFTVRLKEVLP